MKYSIGDRVIVIRSDRYRNEQRIGKTGVIERYSRSYTGVYYIQFIQVKYGNEGTAFLCEDEIELDKEYYRNNKLESIGI